ncbi:LPXTG cell wall anchor domain-containing protein [Enterococcus hirae]
MLPKTNEKNSQFYVIVGLILVSISLWKWRKKGENK